MARACIFCGGAAGSQEHIFPNWLNKVLPLDEPAVDKPELARHTADEAGG